eukprot:s1053_g11.t1
MDIPVVLMRRFPSTSKVLQQLEEQCEANQDEVEDLEVRQKEKHTADWEELQRLSALAASVLAMDCTDQSEELLDKKEDCKHCWCEKPWTLHKIAGASQMYSMRQNVWQPFRVNVPERWAKEYNEALSLLEDLEEPRVVDAVQVLGSDTLLPTQVITTLARAAQSYLEVTVYHASAAVKACQEAGRWQAALALLSAAPALAVRPNEFTYNSAISACEKGRRWAEALAIFAAMPRAKLAANVISYGAAMSACEKAARWEEALFLLASMGGAAVAKNTIAFCNAISACEKGGEWLPVLQLLQQMLDESVERSTVTYCAAISACEKFISEAQVWKDDIAFSAVISACEKGGQWEAALSLLQKMPEVQVAVSTVALSAAVTACEGMGQWEMALHLFQNSGQVDAILANSAIAAAEKGGRWDLEAASQWEAALAVFVEMMNEIPNYSAHGIQLGSVLACLQQVHGRPRALEMLEDFRKSLYATAAEAAEDVNPLESEMMRSIRSIRSFKVIATAPGVLAFEKPAGIETEGALRLVASELQRPVTSTSRLDQATSGIIPVALGDESSGAGNWLRAQWAARLVSKEYICLCSGHFDVKRGEISSSLRQSVDNSMLMEVSLEGRPARTEWTKGGTSLLQVQIHYGHYRTTYKVLASYTDPETTEEVSLLRVEPHTGRKHQIRIHLASIGRPLLGDKRYWLGSPSWCPRLFLHCRRLRLLDLQGKGLSGSGQAQLLPQLLVATYDQFKAIYGKFGVKGSANVVASSFTAGLVYSIITMPFESAKNRMASQKPDPETGKLPYRGTLQTIQTVAGKEGATALYNGFFPYFLRCGGHTVLMFFAVEELQKLYRKTV